MSGWIIESKKVFVKCIAPDCKRRHYARGYCEMHYHRFCRRKYCQTWDEHLNYKIAQRLKETTKNETVQSVISIKYKRTRELYQTLKKINITVFQYKDIMGIIDWKYERIKKHILRLVKLGIIVPIGEHSGGRHAAFKLSRVSHNVY